jgi:hypothetical protein
MKRILKRDDCLDCGVDTIDSAEFYMIRDETWLAANPKRDGMLCVACLEKRLGRELVTDDFTWCPANLANLFTGSDRLRARMDARWMLGRLAELEMGAIAMAIFDAIAEPDEP